MAGRHSNRDPRWPLGVLRSAAEVAVGRQWRVPRHNGVGIARLVGTLAENPAAAWDRQLPAGSSTAASRQIKISGRPSGLGRFGIVVRAVATTGDNVNKQNAARSALSRPQPVGPIDSFDRAKVRSPDGRAVHCQYWDARTRRALRD